MGRLRKNEKRIIAWMLIGALVLTSLGLNQKNSQASTKKLSSFAMSNPVISMLTLEKGKSFQLKSKVKPAKAVVTYKSSKSSVVKVSEKGSLKATNIGKSTITVRAKYGTSKTVKIKVTVVKKLKIVKTVKLSKKSLALKVGETVQLKASVLPKTSTNKSVTYVSKSKGVATVSASGKVNAKKEGSAKIYAYAKDGRGASASCTVTVKKDDAVTSAPTSNPTSAPTSAPTSNPTGNPTAAPIVTFSPEPTTDPYGSTPITIANQLKNEAVKIVIDKDAEDFAGLSLVAESFKNDIKLVSGVETSVVTDITQAGTTAIIAGSIGNNKLIDQLISEKKINVDSIKDKWEVYKLLLVENPVEGVEKAIVVVGSDKRGTIYGLYHISELMGVSPWVYWGDVTPIVKDDITLTRAQLETTTQEPSVKYRGIFLNDEAPSLTSWVAKFGGYNEKFYKEVFELILRLKGNYLWPAMWSNAFSSDGKVVGIANATLADDYGIVMGTSHHEPMCRAGVEWQKTYSKYGTSNLWDFKTNSAAITKFWEDGIKRNGAYDNLITLGMRGEADSSLSGTIAENIQNLKDVVTTQNDLLAKNNLTDTPTLLTIYKEVEQFWYGNSTAEGLNKWDGLDKTTIVLTDDNFGNVRTLPTPEEKDRAAGWGMYYHFDYHGGPRSYEWVNTIQTQKIWEQMSMAYEYGVDDIWIVNVGDLKPMELPISYFLDLAYDFDKYGTTNINSSSDYVSSWTEQQFSEYATNEQLDEIEDLLNEYTKINASIKPETITSSTFSIQNYNEAMTMLARVNALTEKADKLKDTLPEAAQASFYQLVYYPAVAAANVSRMYIYSGLNKMYYNQGRSSANLYAGLLEASIEFDKSLQNTYNNNMPGVGTKWKGMMSSPHVGYTTWDSKGWSYPLAKYLEVSSDAKLVVGVQGSSKVYTAGETATLPSFTNTNKETHYFDLANQGGDSYDFTITTSDAWITVDKTTGTVNTQDTIGVSIDYSQVSETKQGTITVQSDLSVVTIQVVANVTDISSLSGMTFVEENNYISMEAGHYVNKVAASDGATWKEIKNYGKTNSALKVYPDTKNYTEQAEAPYLEYKVYVKSAETYTLQTYLAPTNYLSVKSVSLKTGFSVDEGSMVMVDAFTPSYQSGSGKWNDYVTKNIHTISTDISLTAGEHTIRVYGLDAGAVLQKLVLYRKSVSLPTSYFGPPESYYVGKDV